MRLKKDPESFFVELAGEKPLPPNIQLSQQDKEQIHKTLVLLEAGSELFNKIYPDDEPHENPFFVAEVELRYIYENY